MTGFQLQVTSRLIKALSYQAPLRSLLPPLALRVAKSLISETTGLFLHGSQAAKILETCSPLVAKVVGAFMTNVVLHENVRTFLAYLVDTTEKLHINDPHPAPCEKIEGSYNPPKNGCAYYFEEDGHQIRRNMPFTIDKEREKKKPSDEDCTKIFPRVTKNGVTYLMVWFCKHDKWQ